MKKFIKPIAISLTSLTLGLGMGVFFVSSAQNQKVFELRTYTSTPGNLEKLHARFRDHTTRIFNKHGMEVVGYWSPTDEGTEDTMVYMLEHASRDAANKSWSAFIQDPEWSEVAAQSNADGEILAGIESKYLTATDYSPMK
ncbi:MAG: NIPSNAP family protein [Pseudohongiellaceae bacterium]